MKQTQWYLKAVTNNIHLSKLTKSVYDGKK